jgi:hypothetical protein
MNQSEQNPLPDEQTETNENQVDDDRQMLVDVRKAAGWRVSPRHIDVAMIALDEIGEEPTVSRIAEIVTAFHGDGSKRQKRNADLWRLLGAQLVARGKNGDPDAQLAFIGRAKALADENVSDSDLLLVATALAGANHPLTPEMTADATVWIIDALGPEFDAEQLDDRLDSAVEAAIAERAERANKRRRGR